MTTTLEQVMVDAPERSPRECVIAVEQERTLAINCTVCNQPIPEKRLKAVPTAHQCVECLNKSGDIKRLRRFDEYVGDEKVSTYFIEPNAYLQEAIKRYQSAGGWLERLLSEEQS